MGRKWEGGVGKERQRTTEQTLRTFHMGRSTITLGEKIPADIYIQKQILA